MKNLRNILFTVLAVAMIAGTAFADTYRLGANKVSFNPSAVVTKTAAYTLTASDSLVNVTCSSANIVITLPKISDLSGVSKAYKILKTDSTTYDVVVTPASGDTIGGESTRYLINQNAYMVIQSGGGKNWEVKFESPYVVEDHAAGSTDLGTQGYDETIIFEGATANDYETTFSVTDPTADRTVTFPDGTGTVMLSSLATNSVGAANGVYGASNALVFEGATANDYETSVAPADPTADRTVTLADASGTVVLSSLATNAPDAANSVTGASNALVFEGATANDYEISVAPADATADRTWTLPDSSGTFAGVDGLSSRVTTSTVTGSSTLTTADCGKTFFVGTDALTIGLPPTSAGCILRFVNTGAATNNIITIDPDAADNIWGTFTLAASVVVSEGAAGVTIVNTKATSQKGDSVTLVGDGADGWFILNSTGIWAEGA